MIGKDRQVSAEIIAMQEGRCSPLINRFIHVNQ